MMPVANDPTPVAAEPTRMARPRRVEVVVVSGDDEFLIEIGPLFSEGFRTRPVDSPAAIAGVLSEQGEDAPPTMVLLDAAAVSDPRGAVAQIEAAHPRLPIVVVAPSRDESYWSAAIARGAIIDVVARHDLGSGGFKDVLNRADARARIAPQSAPPGEAAPPAKNNSKLLIAVAVVAALGAGGYFVLHKSASNDVAAPAASVNAPQAGAASTQQAAKAVPVVELLSAARIAFRDQKLLPRDGESHGDSALELYSQVLAQEPKNDEAVDGMQRLFSVIKARVQTDLTANKLDDAQKLVNEFKSTNVNPDGARDLDAQIGAARPKFYAARATELIQANDFAGADQMITQLAPLDHKGADELRRTMEARKADQATQVQLTQLAVSVKQAIDAGNLLEPASDNARTRLNAMRQVSRTAAQTLSAQRDLQNALLKNAQDQGSKEQFDAASKLIAAAGDIASTPEVTEAKKQLQSEIDAANQRVAAAAAKKAADAAQAAAAAKEQTAAAAAAAAPAASTYIAARPTTPLKVVYPAAAVDRKVQGYAIVEFMLQPDGRPSQPSIVESTPARVFDSAAIDAVMGGRYDTTKFTDKQARRARVRLTFKPS